MAKKLTVTQAVRNFSDILGRVRFKGERFILLKGGKAIAELGPTDTALLVRLRELPSLLAALPHLDAEDAERFGDELESARSAAGPAPAVRWDS